MSSFVRPAIDAPVFCDADGAAIDYGHRWRDGAPPDNTYSVATHPERFAPLRIVADALIAHLVDKFDAEAVEDLGFAADLLHQPVDAVRAVRVISKSSACAALTFVFTSYPGVRIYAGALSDHAYPSCGCDACDESWESQADVMEQQVLAVASGNYRESAVWGPGPELWITHAFTYPDGGQSGGSCVAPDDRVREAQEILELAPEGWKPWPPKLP